MLIIPWVNIRTQWDRHRLEILGLLIIKYVIGRASEVFIEAYYLWGITFILGPYESA
jgi:hypothetical protein